jgi:hypothetical protein
MLVAKFRAIDLVFNKKKIKKRCVLSEEKLDQIVVHSEASPKKSLRRLAVQCGMSKSAARVATKLLKLKPYRTILVYQLQPRNAE